MKGNAVRRYEGLFILNTAGKEEGVKDMIDKISNEITATGGRIETVQKMDKKNFARVSDKKYTGGFYVNVIFETKPENGGMPTRLSEAMVNAAMVQGIYFASPAVSETSVLCAEA